MNGTLRLFNLEARRNAAIWFVPVIAAVSWWLLDTQSWTTFLWTSTNRLLQQSVVPFAAPAIAGIAAWMAGRDRRRGTEDLLDSTPRPGTQRRLTLWAATAFWGLLAYALFAVYMMGQTALQATWGGPDFWPVAVVVLAILAHAGWGFFIGGLLRSRLTAPLVGIGALGLQQFAAQHRQVFDSGSSASTWVNQLAAHEGFSDRHALFYLGLTGVALAAIALRERANVLGIAALVLMAAVALGGGVMIWGEYPRNDWIVTSTANGTLVEPASSVPRNNFGQVITSAAPTLPAPVCEGTPVTVCVHPAYQPVLDQAIDDATRLSAPLMGLPGVPTRVEAEDTALGGARIDVTQFADKLVADEMSAEDHTIVNEAQLAIRSWLLQHAGWPTWASGCDENAQIGMAPGAGRWPGQPTPETCAATDRFAKLSTTEQRAWLETHYTDLRAGKLTLKDLP